ncbi:MAG: glycosyltransferase family 2 protein [Patescibacteria group bacterium]
MDFSFIIVNYRTAELTVRCLTSILNNCRGSYEIIVIDNGSNDGSADRLAGEFAERIRLVRNQENLGFARANNQGAELAGGQYLFFLNSDAFLKTDILRAVGAAFQDDSQVAIVAPRLVGEDGRPQAKAYGPFPSLGYLLYKNLIARQDNDFPRRADWTSGAALAIRREVFRALGGWDENFFLYLEDVDLCWRVRQAGYRIKRELSADVIHRQGASLAASPLKRDLYFQSQEYLFAKHYGQWAKTILRLIRWPYRHLALKPRQ